MSNRTRKTSDTETPDAALELLELNRQITAAVAAEITTGGISPELSEIMAARDAIRARLASLEGVHHGRR